MSAELLLGWVPLGWLMPGQWGDLRSVKRLLVDSLCKMDKGLGSGIWVLMRISWGCSRQPEWKTDPTIIQAFFFWEARRKLNLRWKIPVFIQRDCKCFQKSKMACLCVALFKLWDSHAFRCTAKPKQARYFLTDINRREFTVEHWIKMWGFTGAVRVWCLCCENTRRMDRFAKTELWLLPKIVGCCH